MSVSGNGLKSYISLYLDYDT
ncbi:hypothetical protein XSR1_50054 [Xenorhabdus szentirmaii DSM 16338]|uniref:Uncharacterized protein n=1 Tax=Xenorhabdus szentirmaii DSM 16338 TaxID=1427518 RepID=W1J3K4_9GAMM|nr:hypothetical protein XSR1_50054 [Xenorhabdus szentirmaii DSM 16338]